MALLRSLSVLTLLLCVFISFVINKRHPPVPGDRRFPPPSLPSPDSTAVRWLSWSFPSSTLMSNFASSSSFLAEYLQGNNITSPQEDEEGETDYEDCDDEGGCEMLLEYDFYRDSCPQAEEIVRNVVGKLYRVDPDVAPALLRLVFHDCFIEGCDASLLLDAVEGGMGSEKDSPANKGLRGFDVIDTVKSEMEEACPGVVSCADILVLAAREAVVQAGGPFYPLSTGRKDSTRAYKDTATFELPSPHADLSETLAAFSSRGFDERETVTLLGGHSIGVIHCRFFDNRLYNFRGSNKPDPSLDDKFLDLLRSRCNDEQQTSATPQAPSFDAPKSSITMPAPSIDDSKPSSPTPTPSAHGPEPAGTQPASAPFEASPYSTPLSSSKPPSTAPAPSFESWPTPFSEPAPSAHGPEPAGTQPASAPFEASPFSTPLSSSNPPSTAPAPSSESSPTPFSEPAPSINGLEPLFMAPPISSPSSSAAHSPLFLDPTPSSPLKSARPPHHSTHLLHSKIEVRGVDMAYEGRGIAFGTLYYHSLLQGRGILYVDQQLTAGEETGAWVRAYASDNGLFRKDFAQVMMKLSNLQVLAGSMGQVRLNCSRASSESHL